MTQTCPSKPKMNIYDYQFTDRQVAGHSGITTRRMSSAKSSDGVDKTARLLPKE
jgi:hypothetical protein